LDVHDQTESVFTIHRNAQLAGIDVGRLHWSATVPLALQILGLVGFAAGMGLTTWVMLVNRFFSWAVRLQLDRGQQVITAGPYQFVRHPGYSGGLILLLSAGFALGSWIAMAPTLLMLPLMVRRTLIEERMLAHTLPGYADYMRRVPSRIVPGVW
jgi:protein-S-isoprenylcysteine O-methyltransferase Ste14